jgi:flagellar biosynthesis protein FlhF
MQIKKFTAPTLKEATLQMKNELGDDAIVLSTRIIDNDPRYANKRFFEITAGIEDDFDNRSAQVKTTAAKEKPQASSKLKKSSIPEKNFADELKDLTERVYTAPKKKTPSIDKIIANEPEIEEPVETGNKQLENELKEIEDVLLQREVQKRIVDTIINQLRKYSEFLQPSNIDGYVISTISSMIPTSNFEVRKKQRPKVISLIGPTGVGKTTCIAKLAVISKILHNLDIGLLSLDTYRLGAIDQLKIFSEVSNIDLRVAYSPADIPSIINEFKKKDLVFIDTAGRSQNNTDLLKESKKFLQNAKVDEIYLVLSTTSTTKNMLDVAEKFKVINYSGIVLTKLDEAVSFGNILNLVSNISIPIKYLTNGQVIPDDIIAADPEFIANMIYTGKISK